ncbi:uncharacterized protein LOC117171136 [Belonocnema kinseyi]|uniref:uncharacterized protein LOC117171136 n=1 Tax=Belonocnema kinseyi TaxID=2817044 RepID=UPI00143DB0B0|nr:uncharacterized protein LOC117171136 [Belonocnema kinseyi]
MSRDRIVGKSGENMNNRYERTRSLTSKTRRYGYQVTEIWDCDFRRLKKEDKELTQFLKHHPVLKLEKMLNPRDSFYGGRTGNTKCYYEVKDGEIIEYKDVCSLYPFISKIGVFPIGHPTLYDGYEEGKFFTKPNYDLSKVEGECLHKDESQRVFEGTWVSLKLKRAIELGYKFIEISEIWQYMIVQYDPSTHKGGLFAAYMNMFLKIKQETTGWPSYCIDEASKVEYLRQYEQAEGIKLDRDKINKNPGLRSVAKLCLNSFWDKFVQRNNLPQTDIVRTKEKLLRMLLKPEIKVRNIVPANKKMLYLCWAYREEAVTPLPDTNVVIAAYTTVQARLKLYDCLSQLDRRVLYYDTDSCVYITRGTSGEYIPPIGSLLGDLTDELEKYHGNDRKEPIEIKSQSIRTTHFHHVVTRDEKKICRIVDIKRRMVDNYDSLPYGYKTTDNSDNSTTVNEVGLSPERLCNERRSLARTYPYCRHVAYSDGSVSPPRIDSPRPHASIALEPSTSFTTPFLSEIPRRSFPYPLIPAFQQNRSPPPSCASL